ncbi:MAG: zf-HC2 domain-containing protein [Thermoanaerobaculia bacterium]|nr:zf-HC2 domain-containing protein [Thermoanaerobaculia bacterium]
MKNHPTGTPASCPDLESLAALLDGRLHGAERERVVAHLDSCEACYEVFVESGRALAEEGKEGGGEGGTVLRPARDRWGRGGRRLAAAVLAAAATVAVAIGILGRTGGSAASDAVALQRALAVIAAGPEAVAGREAWSALRSGQALAGVNSAQRAFRLGVLSAELEVVLRAGDREAGEPLVREIVALLRPFELSQIEVEQYRRLLEELESDGPLEPLVERARETAATLPEAVGEEAGLYLLGLWAEAGRLAAAAGDDDFLRHRAVRRGARWTDSAELDRRLRPLVDRAREQLHGGATPELERAFARLVQAGAEL